MKVAKLRSVTLIALFASSLLLALAANCALEKQDTSEAVGPDAKDELVVANQFCLVCHIDFEQEQLAVNHQLAGIGCERCHGESKPHRSDEANITPPEIMYPKARINPTCMMCHPRHEIRHVKDHRPVLSAAQTIFDLGVEDSASAHKAKYCTDCHGPKHRIEVRTVRWNKATGELIKTQ